MCDMKSLYTSIPHNYGFEAIHFWIEKHPGSLHSRFSKGFVLESVKIILKIINVLLMISLKEKVVGQLWVPFSLQHMQH